MKKYLTLIAILLTLVMVLASCGGEEAPIGGDSGSRDTAAVPEDAGSLKIGVKEDDGKVMQIREETTWRRKTTQECE